MKRLKKILSGLLVLCLLMGFTGPVTVFGAASTISSVNLRVGMNDIAVGDTLPDIVVGDKESSDAAYVYSTSNYFGIEKAEWVTSKTKELNVGDTPRMKVWLDPTDYEERRFKGGYHSSNVKINGGTFVSASISNKKLVVTLDLSPIKGQFEAPEEAYWNTGGYGRARWRISGTDNSYQYEVALYRGNSQVHKVETTGTSYNFYPYMTKAGTYSFRVRVIPKNADQEKYGKKSDWISSDEIYLAQEDVSDGNIADANADVTPSGGILNVGWNKSGNLWFFRYPDGTSPKDEWLAWNGKWYLFDPNGWMLTGWQVRNGQTYYLDESGAMLTGWVRAGDAYYYLNPTPDAFEGMLVKKNWVIADGNIYYMNDDGVRVEGWYSVDGNWFYFYPGTGIRAANTWVDGFYLDADGVWRK